MVAYTDIANTVIWSKPGKSLPVWVTPLEQSIMFAGDGLEDDELFTSICDFLQCKKSTGNVKKIKFGIVFTDDSLNFFQIGKSDTVEKILFSPSLDLMRENGAFKKTLWHYLGILGMI